MLEPPSTPAPDADARHADRRRGRARRARCAPAGPAGQLLAPEGEQAPRCARTIGDGVDAQTLAAPTGVESPTRSSRGGSSSRRASPAIRPRSRPRDGVTDGRRDVRRRCQRTPVTQVDIASLPRLQPAPRAGRADRAERQPRLPAARDDLAQDPRHRRHARRRPRRNTTAEIFLSDPMTQLADNEYLFTSESVTEGHPDKVADQISDGVLDAVLQGRPVRPRRLRDARQHRPRRGLGRDLDETYVDIQEIARETIRKIGYTDADLGFSADSCAVLNAIDKQSPDIAQGVDQALRDAHRPRRRRRARHRRRRRPGHDVRLRLERDRRAHAAADLAGAQARQAPRRRPQGRGRPVPAPRRQDPGLRPLPRRQAGRDREAPDLHAAQGGRRVARSRTTSGSTSSSRPAAGRSTTTKKLPQELPRQPDRPLRHRRPRRRRGPDRPQDHRRHLRRHGPPRRRRVLRQGPVEGRPLGRLRRALRRQERRRRRPGRPRRGPGRVRDRRRAPGVGHGRDVRDREDRPRPRSQELVDEHFDLRPGSFREELKLHRPIYQKTAAYGHFGREDHDFTWERTDKAAILREAAGVQPSPAGV